MHIIYRFSVISSIQHPNSLFKCFGTLTWFPVKGSWPSLQPATRGSLDVWGRSILWWQLSESKAHMGFLSAPSLLKLGYIYPLSSGSKPSSALEQWSLFPKDALVIMISLVSASSWYRDQEAASIHWLHSRLCSWDLLARFRRITGWLLFSDLCLELHQIFRKYASKASILVSDRRRRYGGETSPIHLTKTNHNVVMHSTATVGRYQCWRWLTGPSHYQIQQSFFFPFLSDNKRSVFSN